MRLGFGSLGFEGRCPSPRAFTRGARDIFSRFELNQGSIRSEAQKTCGIVSRSRLNLKAGVNYE